MTKLTYVRKITASLGWLRSLAEMRDPNTNEILRPASEPVLLMRVYGRIEDGWQEVSEYGDYIRWLGNFRAICPTRDGTEQTFASRNLILPALASDILAMPMTVSDVETKIKGRTGKHYAPTAEFAETEFALEIWLKAPTGASSTGYEYEVRTIFEPNEEDVLAALSRRVTATIAAPETKPEAEPEPVPETKPRPEPVPKRNRDRIL